MRVPVLPILIGLLSTASAAAAQSLSEPFYPADLDAPKLARLVDDHLAAARAAVEHLVAVRAKRRRAGGVPS